MTARMTFIYILLMTLGLTACVTERLDGPDEGRAFLEGEVKKVVDRLPYQNGMALFTDINHLVSFGRFAVDPMIECLDSPNEKVRSSAALVLGTLRADAALEKLLSMVDDQNKWVRLEVARAVLEIGAWDTIPIIIDGLNDEDLRTRELCFHLLNEKTGEDFGYTVKAEKEDRVAAVDRWKIWWERSKTDPNIQGNLTAK
ncbi:MAG: HEAT repeat domain-containing protein [Planctomycetota bacterium]